MTLRELSDAAGGKLLADWNRQSWLCFYLLQPHAAKGQQLSPEQFDPYSRPAGGEQVTTIEFSDLYQIW